MIKTHKPRGHVWSHSSAFQQTKEFRNIVFRGCVAPEEEVLVEDSDDELPISGRTAKRRRIEKLADDFLNGIPLFISSVRPCPQTLRSTVALNQKALNDLKFKLPAVNLRREHDALWEDVEDDAEILERLRRSIEADHEPSRNAADDISGHDYPIDEVEEIRAQASCGRTRRRWATNLSSQPSDEALQRAAALRDRRLCRAQSDVPVVARRSSRFAEISETEAEPRSEPCCEDGEANAAITDSRWLSRRQSKFSFARYDADDDSADELRLSGLEGPPRSSLHFRQPVMSKIRHEEVLHAETKSQIASGSAVEYVDFVSVEPPSRFHDDLRVAQHGEVELQSGLERSAEPNDRNSANLEFTPQHGSDPKRGDRKSQQAESESLVPKQRSMEAGDELPTRDVEKQDVAQQANGRRAKSTGNYTPQQPSPPSKRTRSAIARQSQTAPEPQMPRYTSAQPSQNGSTPFQFRPRKRASPPPDNDKERERTADGEPQQKRGDGSLLSSDNIVVADERACGTTDAEISPAHTPMLDMTFAHDSSFASNLNTALVDEHRDNLLCRSEPDNILPRNPKSSSQHFPDCNLVRSEVNEEQQQIVQRPTEDQHLPIDTRPESWAGTQFLLNKAQRDLMVSPEKLATDNTLGMIATPQLSGNLSLEPPASSPREPLKQLSQEPVQSTQQLLGEFDGWSTVKKPRAADKESPAFTPTAAPKKAWTAINEIASKEGSTTMPGSSLLASTVRGRSSRLRFSIPSTDSPDATASEIERTAAPISSAERMVPRVATPPPSFTPRDERSSSIRASANTEVAASKDQTADPTVDDESFTPGPSMLSFQAAQMQSSLPREASNLSQTLDDLRGFLNTTDVDGIMSQPT